jgi:hypothetical protein
MLRAALLVFAALLGGGCQPGPEAEQLGSPGDSVAGTETKRDDRSPRSRSTDASVASNSGLANSLHSLNSLVAVATTSASEAQPCERVCGSLGDCLLAEHDYTTTAASGLELACLDMCVHSPELEPAKIEFLACGSQTQCGPLQACAERSWTALAAARQRPEVAAVIASADPCKLGCRWMFSCMYANLPPGEAALDPQLEQLTNDCTHQCDDGSLSASEREYFAQLPACMVNRCSIEGVYYCYEEAMR